jgi:hypothetical protein
LLKKHTPRTSGDFWLVGIHCQLEAPSCVITSRRIHAPSPRMRYPVIMNAVSLAKIAISVIFGDLLQWGYVDVLYSLATLFLALPEK